MIESREHEISRSKFENIDRFNIRPRTPLEMAETLQQHLQLHLNSLLDNVREYQSFIILSLIVAAVTFVFFQQFVFSTPIPKISVPLPAQVQPGWTSKVLSKPSIYGKNKSEIQCYCPATGQLIATVPAATTADVDNAIARAKAAQAKWAKTTFKQRTLVLKTLLKFILENQGTSALLVITDLGRGHCASIVSRFRGNLPALKYVLTWRKP